MKRKMMYTAVLLCAVAGLAGCGSKSSQSVSVTKADYNRTADETAVHEEKMKDGGAIKEGRSLTDSSPVTQTLPSSRKMIHNVDMTVETDAFDQLIKSLTVRAGELGGYVEQSGIKGNRVNYKNEPIPRNADMTLRIPADKLDNFVAVVEQNGNVTNKAESTQDVTLQYSDLESKKKSLTLEQDRLWVLLEKADTLDAVIALEDRLSDLRYQLDSMESQLKLYDSQVDYSKVHLYVNEIRGASSFTPSGSEGVGRRIQNGFRKNLNAVAHGCTNLFVGLAAFSPIWVPLAVIAAAVLLILRYRKRKLKGMHKLPDTDEVKKKEEQ